MSKLTYTNDDLSSVGEFPLIELIRKQINLKEQGIIGIGDDAAVVNFTADKKLLLTTDMLIEGGHFNIDMSPLEVGRKAINCNISDIAAMGGYPLYALISLGAPKGTKKNYILKLYEGLEIAAEEFGVKIIGGDTVKSDKIIINVALIGEVNKKQIVLRSGAQNGDTIFVTGELGHSFKSKKHLTFTPRIKESQYLVHNFKPTSMIDISDGLLADLGHILKESKLGAIVFADCVPIAPGAELENALSDGEDYELIFTLSASDTKRLLNTAHGFKFYAIGSIVDKSCGLRILDSEGTEILFNKKGFSHF